MTPTPAFTVIVPCCNGAATLDETLRSARAQTAADLEILVVDDGSTDQSAAIVEAHAAADAGVRLVRQENRGVGAARNAGLALARGRYVSFLDADDVLEPEKLARQGAVLDAEPAVGLVVCDGCVIDASSRVTWPTLVDLRRFAGHPSLLSVCLQGGPFPPVVPLVRTALAREVGGFTEDRRAAGWADIDFWMRLAVRGIDYHVLPDRLVRYRSTTTSMSGDTAAMETAAELVYADLFRAHPAAAATALRAVQHRMRELEAARDDMRQLATRLVDEAAALRATVAVTAAAAAPAAVLPDIRRRDVAALVAALARASAGVPRPLWIWGAGAAGRQVLASVTAGGGRVAAFVDSDPAKSGSVVAGVPVQAPADLVRAAVRPFVVVASMHAAAILPTLTALGWQRDSDVYVADPDTWPAAPTAQERVA